MFITFEGLDGSGKTTVINELLKKLKDNFKFLDYVLTREPGGKDIKESEKIREMILDSDLEFSPITEALLYTTSRRIHIDKVILPALAQNKIVFCDRYYDSFYAYQGYGRNLGMEFTKTLTELAVGNTIPNLTFFFDISPFETRKRRSENNLINDRLELEDFSFHNRVYEGYLEIIKNNKENRFVVVDATKPVNEIVDFIFNYLVKHKDFVKFLK
ncbi:dTMP kinase [Mycoplasmopsis synoviae]|uniref:dTMP kinase n=1 Tax=Mycoplasmopsis synoviae TaxID=2109 RepID=UPI001CE0E656|nr:dTMP kinase [Mycoplasmopsis synoviae]UBX97676.1 dTMP kinase [Mycoplasmopsis synoviae]UBX98361.1 dTMP kinase [Mycoplasmopsis synoviae]UBX98712.1 dTMP kinase [Mycoplasmopsis synoviae]UBX99538.1 dTMP kinase [Mycoplasmopsis synoviae]UBX99881.1 dTMP kinase [Mycoplasmopsis synoviae]